jgi:hypothetical protein
MIATVIGCAVQQPISQVIVRDRDFGVVKTLSQDGELASFESVWQSKKGSSLLQTPNWTYKLDIHRGSDSQRWLYDPTGWTSLLAVKGAELYRIDHVSSFNAALGIPNTPLEPTPKDGAAQRPR